MPLATSVPDRLLDTLADLLGPTGLVTESDDVEPYVVDWRGAHRGVTPAVLRPGSTSEVAAAVRACAEARVGLVPQGGGTGLCGGAVPDASGAQLVLSTGRLRRIRDVDAEGGSITVEAGVVLREVQDAAARAGRLFPLSLGSEGSCTIGGNLATNAGGTNVLRYGMVRGSALGLEVVLADGRVWDGLRTLRKDNTGYDLTQLFIGSEGTLGIITAATLALAPATPRRVTAWLGLADVAAAVAVLGLLRAHAGEHLTAYELMSHEALGMVTTHLPGARSPLRGAHPWYGLVELAGSESAAGLQDALEGALAEAVDAGVVLDAAVAGGSGQRQALWALREGISEAQGFEGPSLKHDVTVPVGSLARFVDASAAALHRVLPGTRLVTYGHVGDGNLHHNLSRPRNMSDEDFLRHAPALSEAIYDQVAALHGSVSAEHGLGVAKRDVAARYKDPVELALMHSIKGALDPEGLMNPGKVLAPATTP